MTLTRRPQRELDILNGLTPHTKAHAVHLLSAHPALVITSGYRTPEHNREVGGSPTSWHLKRRGVDFDGPEWLLHAARTTARSQRITPHCTGPEEVLVHAVAGHSGLHLHVAW